MKRALVPGSALLLVVLLTGPATAQSGRIDSDPAPVVSQIVNGSFLGAFLSDVSDARARELRLAEVRGAVVEQVVEDSPAAAAALQESDVILNYNQERIQNAAQIHRLLMETPPGRSVRLGISRAGKQIDVAVTTGERPYRATGRFGGTTDQAELFLRQAETLTKEAGDLQQQHEKNPDQKLLDQAQELLRQAQEFRHLATEHRARVEELRGQGQLRGFAGGTAVRLPWRPGIRTLGLSQQLGSYFAVPDGQGVLVTEVETGSAAARAGLKAGDCIVQVNGRPVQGSADISAMISEAGSEGQAASGRTNVPLKIVRDRREMTLAIETERR